MGKRKQERREIRHFLSFFSSFLYLGIIVLWPLYMCFPPFSLLWNQFIFPQSWAVYNKKKERGKVAKKGKRSLYLFFFQSVWLFLLLKAFFLKVCVWRENRQITSFPSPFFLHSGTEKTNFHVASSFLSSVSKARGKTTTVRSSWMYVVCIKAERKPAGFCFFSLS